LISSKIEKRKGERKPPELPASAGKKEKRTHVYSCRLRGKKGEE